MADTCNGTVTFTGCTFSKNAARRFGGAFDAFNTTQLAIVGSTFTVRGDHVPANQVSCGAKCDRRHLCPGPESATHVSCAKYDLCAFLACAVVGLCCAQSNFANASGGALAISTVSGSLYR